MANRGDAIRVQLNPQLCPTSISIDGESRPVRRILHHRSGLNDRDVWRVDITTADGPQRHALIQHDLVTGGWVLLSTSERR